MLANLLLPIGAVWDIAGRLRAALANPYRAPVPVVCVGNLVVGGAGKTPVVLALASELRAFGFAVHIVTRGYGGRLVGPLRVDPVCHDAAAVGDEALLLPACAPTWVARDRAAGIRAAVDAGAGMVLLDDGFQNPTIAKDLSLVVIDAAYGLGNSRVIPAGPLRESVARGFSRAHALILLGTGIETNCPERTDIGAPPVIRAVVVPIDGERLAGARLLAFAGIGRPNKFFATLRSLGVQLVAARAFPDHHPYRARELEQLFQEAERLQARLITTTKDIVRLPPGWRGGIEVLEIEIHWLDPAAVERLIRPVLLPGRDREYDFSLAEEK